MPHNYTLISAGASSGGKSVNKGLVTTYEFQEDEIILYYDKKIIKVDDDERIRENFINNGENLITNGYKMKCLFILHVLGKCIITHN